MNQILLCGGFDIGGVYINEAWPSIVGGHPKMGYGLSLSRAEDTWQRMLNDAAPGDITNAMTEAHKDVESLVQTLADADPGKGPVDISGPVLNIRTDYKYIADACRKVGYTLSQPLKEK